MTCMAQQNFCPHPPLSAEPLRLGTLEALMVSEYEQLRAAQRLRHSVFYDELGARKAHQQVPMSRSPSPDQPRSIDQDIDEDVYDAHCDHLIVVDHANADEVVGTYRLIRRPCADKVGKFYTANEYDISPILAFPGSILELGRSCVAPAYRNQQAMKLLWRGLGAYITYHNIKLMFGCASLKGTSISDLRESLAYLYHYHLAPLDIRPVTLAPHYISLDQTPKQAIDPKRALCSLPPLLKAYLRAGGFVGDGAYVDHDFNTTDVSIVVRTDLMRDTYLKQYL